MKALILTRCPVSDDDRAFVNQSNVLKIAVNRADFKADYRLFADWFHWQDYLKYPEKLITRNKSEITNKDKFLFYEFSGIKTDKEDLYFAHTSLIPAIDFAAKILKATEILLVADNKIKDDYGFTEAAETGINESLKLFNANLYQFSNGNFNLKTKTIKDFINV
jgi:hypothetical protein